MSKHLAGKKISKRHTTVIDAAIPLIRVAEKMSLVSKIVLGVIASAKHGPHRVKYTEIPGGIKAKVRGGIYVQEIYFYTDQATFVMKILKDKFLA